MGILGGNWGFLTRGVEDKDILDVMGVFCVDIFITSVSRMRGQELGYLEDLESFWPEICRTGSFLMLWITFFDHKKDTLRVSCWYLYWNCVENGGTWRTLKGPDWRLGGHGHSFYRRWSYLTLRKIPWKCCVYIFIRSVSRMELLGGLWGFLTKDSEDRVILYINESFMFISLLLVCQGWGNWRTLILVEPHDHILDVSWK